MLISSWQSDASQRRRLSTEQNLRLAVPLAMSCRIGGLRISAQNSCAVNAPLSARTLKTYKQQHASQHRPLIVLVRATLAYLSPSRIPSTYAKDIQRVCHRSLLTLLALTHT